MAKILPYLSAPGSLKSALDKIQKAATPDRVTQDFVSTKLQIKGGTGKAIPPYLKKIGFVAADGAPTELYKRFRNHAAAGAAAAEALRIGYGALSEANEYFYDLTDAELADLIVQVTGTAKGSQVAKCTLSTLKHLKAFANFDTTPEPESGTTSASEAPEAKPERAHSSARSQAGLGLNLSYTINLNLPATSDQSVFNAIFRSLKDHLLSSHE